MTRTVHSAASAAAFALVGTLAGCASQAPAADRFVYVTDAPMVVEPRPAQAPQRDLLVDTRPLAQDRADVTESERRAWIEANYGPRPAAYVEPAPEVGVQEQYERVVYVEREPRWYDYLPPIALGFSYSGGHGHHGHHGHGGWGWNLAWGWPGCGW